MKRTDSGSVSGTDFSFEKGSKSNVEVTWNDRLRDIWEEFIYKPGLVAWDDWRTRIGATITMFFILMGTVGASFYRTPSTNQVPRSEAPFQNMDYIFGTTPLGEDVLAKIIHATPDILMMITSGALWATGLAVLIGILAGYKGGLTDRILTSISDVAMSIPGLPLIMVLLVTVQPTNPLVIGAIITINYWAGLGRGLRSQVLTLRDEPYVEASRTMGVGTFRIMFKDIIPNLMPFVLVNFVFAARYVIFQAVGLYYLGILPSTTSNWGILLNQAVNQYGALFSLSGAYLVFIPTMAILLLTLGLILLAQGTDRIFNPRVRTRLAGESESTEDEGRDEPTASDVMGGV